MRYLTIHCMVQAHPQAQRIQIQRQMQLEMKQRLAKELVGLEHNCIKKIYSSV